MKAKILIIAAVIGLGVSTVALGDEIQFVTSPQVVRAVVPHGQIITKTVTIEQPTVNSFVSSLDQPDRFQLIEKKGIKEVYLDKQTGERWRVEVRRD